MHTYHYLIIGGGIAAAAAVKGIRERDRSSSIAILTQEEYPCYERAMLSYSLWMGIPEDAIWSPLDTKGLTYHLGKKIVELHPKTQTVIDQHGTVYWYQKLLLATGASPIPLPCSHQGALSFYNYADYKKLKGLTSAVEDFIIIGGGVLGRELTASLAYFEKKVTLMYPNHLLFEDIFPKGFALHMTNVFKERGVTLAPLTRVTEVGRSETCYTVKTADGKTHQSGGVIVAIGVAPNINLAVFGGLTCENGIVVNRELVTSDKNIYAAGDVASTYSPFLEKRVRCCHEDESRTMGWQAGRNMAGAKEEYCHLPSYRSELFGMHYSVVGEASDQFDLVEDWQELYHKGVIYYLHEGRVVGGVLVGIETGADLLRELIASKEIVEKKDLTGRISS